ncbi:MAG: hypothetical protein HZC47_05015 [Methanobacterium sp.]|uniref:hypothetical protein n=1 Tax=Methanobacterium sp. TaxID=2164 RepID=UPI003D64B2CB|nr:hypothetical protein [Methanobacterium sp.]
MNQDIYFPLRSNLDFFEKRANQPDLISKIKQSVLMYENIYFDAGAYELSCGDNGSFSNYFPPEQIHDLDLDVPESTRTGSHVIMQLEPNGRPFCPIPPSDNSKSYTVCFQKLIYDIGIQNEKFINFGIYNLTNYGKGLLRKSVWDTREYKKYIDGETFFKDKILENFHFSLLCSESIKTPMMIDSLHDRLVDNINKDIIRKADMRLEIFNKINDLLKFIIPDFSSLSVDEILDLRKDNLFNNFRDKLLKINEFSIKNEIENNEKIEIEALFLKELMEEAIEFAPSDKKLQISGVLMLLGFLPYIGNVASLGNYLNEIKTFTDFENSSMAFIIKYSNKK